MDIAMNSKTSSQDCSSIDENPVACRSIDTNVARANLQKLQDHVNKTFSNISSLGPCAARAMSDNDKPVLSYSLPPEAASLIERPPSIKNEDDLFRGDTDSEHSDDAQGVDVQQKQPSKVNAQPDGQGVREYHVESTSESREEGENKTISGCGNTCGFNIPNFGEIGLPTFFSRSSKSSEQAECQTVEGQDTSHSVKCNNSEDTSEGATSRKNLENFDFKVEYRSKRSQSDVKEKRKRYSQRDDYEIEEVFDEEYPVPVRKSNSLPDLILSLSSSSSSPRSVTERNSPDVIASENQRAYSKTQQDRKTLKDSFEGRSSFEKPAISSTVPERRKPSFGRSVSFNEKTDCRYYQMEEPVLSPNDEKVEVGSEEPDKGETEEEPPASPKSPADGRRQLFSKSSGYQTGSDHSRESHDTQNGSQDETFEVGNNDSQIKNLRARENGEGMTLDSGTSSSSNETLLENIIDESERYTNDLSSASTEEFHPEGNEKDSVEGPSAELPYLSIMDKTPENSLTEKKDLVVRKDYSIQSAVPSDQSTGDNLESHLLMAALDFKRSQSTLGQSMQSSIGNVPKLGMLDDSVTIGPSLMATVDEVDKKQGDKVRKKYLNQDGSLNMMPDESWMAVKSRPSLGSSLLSPSSLMLQEFEEIIKKNPNDPDAITNACHRLLGAGSTSSPGQSPFEFGDGRDKRSKFQIFTVEDIERASRCSDAKCPEQACANMRKFIMLLKLDIDETDTLNAMLNQFLESIWQHRQRCEELICPVLYCQKCWEWCPHGWNPNLLLQEIKFHLKNPLSYLEQKSEPKFIKLKDSVRDSPPQQFVSYIPLSLIQESEKALLVQDLQTQSLCVIKEYPLFEDDHQIRALKSLRNLDHPHIVPLLWMLEFSEDNIVHICSQFMRGGSLREYLDMIGQGLPWLHAVRYLKQITDAVCFLHSRGVIYLHWESSNMMFPDTRRDAVMISDFAFSHCVRGEPDIGALKQCLPFNLCPPELLNNNTVCEESDCWGVACLLVEMMTGTPVWYELRHEDRATAHKTICDSIPNIERPLLVDQETVFQNCWKKNPHDRCSMKDLNSFLTTILSR